MKVEYSDAERTEVPYRDIAQGECFGKGGRVHIMGNYLVEGRRVSVDLGTGVVLNYHPDTLVISVSAKVIVSK